MYPVHIAFSGYALIGVTLFILAAAITFFLLRIPQKTAATWYLTLFFALVALSGATSVLANAFFYWDRLFVPWQDFWIIAAGAALSQFAYGFPYGNRTAPGAKKVLILMGGLTLVALVYCVIFDLRFLFFWTPNLDVSDAYYLLLPLSVGIVIIIFFRRTVHYSALYQSKRIPAKRVGFLQHLIHTQGRDAQALRNMALALSIAFLPGLQTIVSWPAPYGFILSNIGSLLAISILALVYFNYAPEFSSFMSKLVGITLATVLLIFSVIGSFNIYQLEKLYHQNVTSALAVAYEAILNGGALSVAPSPAVYAVSWDANKPNDAAAHQLIYAHSNKAASALSHLLGDNTQGYLDKWSYSVDGITPLLANHEWRIVNRYGTFPVGSGQVDYTGFLFVENDTAYEIGFSALEQEEAVSEFVAWWMGMLVLSSALVLLVFPLFFHHTLVAPVENLLAGVKRVNQGELKTAVPIQFNDEIGYLTRSFNTLSQTLNQSQQQQTMLFNRLQTSYDELEARIAERTQELSAFTDLTMLPGEQETLTDILQPALTQIIEIGLCQTLSVHLLAEDHASLTLTTHRFLPETAVLTQATIPLSSSFAARIQQVDAPLLIRPNRDHTALPSAFTIPDYQHYLGCPLVAGEQVHGWLSCYRPENNEFNMGEISLMVALARQIGIIIENFQLRQRIRQVAADEERKPLGRDLHDSVTQLLYSMTLFTRAAQEATEDRDETRLQTNLNQLADISLQALREMRFMLFELDPPSLEKMGLIGAINTRLDMVERRLGVRAAFTVKGTRPRPKQVDHEIYYVMIEALNNCMKHAHADQLDLIIDQENGCVQVVITDNGVGFDMSQTSLGLGLENMRHRIEGLNGRLHIKSSIGGGTKIWAVIPLEEEPITLMEVQETGVNHE